MLTQLDKNTALVIIDLMQGLAGFPTAHPMNEVIERSARLVDAFHQANLPVVFVRVNPTKMAQSQTRKDQKARSVDNLPDNFLDIVPQLGKLDDDLLITKYTWGAFFETGLHDELKKRGVTGIVLCGVATSIGVEGTARQAAEFDYNVTFAIDAMSDMHIDAHNNSLKYIFPRIGELDTTDKIIEYLKQR